MSEQSLKYKCMASGAAVAFSAVALPVAHSLTISNPALSDVFSAATRAVTAEGIVVGAILGVCTAAGHYALKRVLDRKKSTPVR